MSMRISTGAFAAWLCVGSLKTVMENGVIGIYSGPQVSSANAAETGELLCWLTVDGLDFVPGAPGNGLNLEDTIAAFIEKAAAENWTGDFLKDGIMGWFRYYSNAAETGESETAIRIDGRVGTSRADLEVVTTQASLGGSCTPTKFKLNFSVVE